MPIPVVRRIQCEGITHDKKKESELQIYFGADFGPYIK
jgi:hypothetical protein